MIRMIAVELEVVVIAVVIATAAAAAAAADCNMLAAISFIPSIMWCFLRID